MKARRSRFSRRAATLVTAIMLLLMVATMSAVVLSMRVSDVAISVDAVQRLRADAAARGALQLAAWRLRNDADLKAAIAETIDNEGDTWRAGADPLVSIRGELPGVSFEVAVWPRPDELRMRARALATGAHSELWSRISVTRKSGKKPPAEVGHRRLMRP